MGPKVLDSQPRVDRLKPVWRILVVQENAMAIGLRDPRGDDLYVSDRVFDGVRSRDAGTTARDRDRALKQLERLRTDWRPGTGKRP